MTRQLRLYRKKITTVKLVLNGHFQIDQILVFKTNCGSLKVKSIVECSKHSAIISTFSKPHFFIRFYCIMVSMSLPQHSSKSQQCPCKQYYIVHPLYNPILGVHMFYCIIVSMSRPQHSSKSQQCPCNQYYLVQSLYNHILGVHMFYCITLSGSICFTG